MTNQAIPTRATIDQLRRTAQQPAYPSGPITDQWSDDELQACYDHHVAQLPAQNQPDDVDFNQLTTKQYAALNVAMCEDNDAKLLRVLAKIAIEQQAGRG